MNSPARAALARTIAALRRLLAGRESGEPGDIGRLLAAPFGFDPQTGVPKPVSSLSYLRPHEKATAESLRAWHAQLVAASPERPTADTARSAFDQMRYELGYTAVHRLCALRMAEEREVVVECVRRGRASDGFSLFLRIAGDTSLGSQGEAYGFFLDRLYDEFARSLPSVFDRRAPASLVAPSATALDEMTRMLASDDLADAWQHEETLGWIFEDWNDPRERKEMRQSPLPRTARELAVRNQFFTPRWVVEFLTDNTLGRLWFERTGGATALESECRYLAYRKGASPDEPGSLRPPPQPVNEADPRDIRVLDPACGSGHFLLYAFTLLETIYLEAWGRRCDTSPGRRPLWEEFPDEAVFRREVPRLIIEHNLYGVDIDPRCVQEAALSLWLRAHTSWKRASVRAADRPVVRTAHVVSAQALPESPELRAKLLGTLKPAVLGRLVEKLFLRVGEMGVLLRLDDALRETLAEVKRDYVAWKQAERTAQSLLFKDLAEVPKQVSLDEFRELAALGDDEFWREAENRVAEAVEALVDAATDREHPGSRLFADGVRHGFEYLDVARMKFDVILMNPPFGEPTEGTKDALDAAYPSAGGDLYAMFYERAIEMLRERGRVGAITNRTWLALPTLADFRTHVVRDSTTAEIVADLGSFVLNAQVETAAVVLRRGSSPHEPGVWLRLVKTRRKADTLLEAVRAVAGHPMRFDVPISRFDALPSRVFGYWMSDSLIAAYAAGTRVRDVADVKQGTATAADPRFLRLTWEVPPTSIGLDRAWARFAKGGEYRPFYDDVHLVIRWADAGREIIAWGKGRPQNTQYFGRAGVTWPRRTTKPFGPRALPVGIAFGDKGPAAIRRTGDPLELLAVLASAPARLLLSVRLGAADDAPGSAAKSYEVGLVRDLAWPSLDEGVASRLRVRAAEAVDLTCAMQIAVDETAESCLAFAIPGVLLSGRGVFRDLRDAAEAFVRVREDSFADLAAIQAEIDRIVADAYGLSASDRAIMDEELEPPIASYAGEHDVDVELFRAAYVTKNAVDGARLPGGVDAESDVRVEHRRAKQVQLRDQAMLCRLFEIRPERFASIRRGLGLLRPSDVARCAADLFSYAVGAAFGRWDVRLVAHPEWIPAFDPFGAVPPCPLGQLVDSGGMPATASRIASDAWLAARRHGSRLPDAAQLGGAPADATQAEYPIGVAWDGILEDDTLYDDLARRPDDQLVQRVGTALDYLLGDARPEIEHDALAAMKVTTLDEWIRPPARFFDDHLARYSKSERIAPIYWPLSTDSGGLVFWVYGPRFSSETLAAIVNRLRASVERLGAQIDRLRLAGQGDSRSRRDADRLAREATERNALLEKIRHVIDRGYVPHPDDGTVVTLAPFAFAFRHGRFRARLEEVADGLERHAYDWAHVAMSMWPEHVRKKCESDASLAIAHGLAVPPAVGGKPKRSRGTRPRHANADQLPLGEEPRK